ncbi:MAG: ABC transporter substrate-binding protein [Planctomycetota bacterium]
MKPLQAPVKRPLRVASDLNNPPFIFLKDEKPAGRDVEMMQSIAEELGLTLEWRQMPFAELLAALTRHEVDVVCSTVGITPERAVRVNFSRPYYDTDIAVVVQSADGEAETLADLRGRRVGAAPGTTSERAVRRQLPGSTGVFEPQAERTLEEMLKLKEIDALVMDGPAADLMVAESQGVLRQLPENLGSEYYALAFAKGNTRLMTVINRILDHLEAVGKFHEWDRKYQLPEK